MKVLLALLFFSFNSIAMQVKIRCDKLDGASPCLMSYQGARFMDVNNRSISFFDGNHCYDNSCDWIGNISPDILYEGMNQANFQVRTNTSNPNLYTKKKYSFYFAGNFKDSFVSTRRGVEVDRASISFDLSLQEIDPALYNEYVDLKAQFEASVGRGQNPVKRYDELRNSLAEINKKIAELTNLALSIRDKNFDEIDAETLNKLGIAENHIKLLKTRKEELIQYSNQAEQTREQLQSQIISRYEVLRARARTYDSNLPDLPIEPEIQDSTQYKISAFVEELNNELISILIRIDDALSRKNFKIHSEALSDWKRASDHSISLYTQSSDINESEKALLYGTIHDGSLRIFKGGVTNDSWRKVNTIPENIRSTINELAASGNSEAESLRNTLNFQKINQEIETDVKIALSKAEQLSNKLNSYQAETENQKDAKKIASAALKVSLSSIDEAVQSGTKNPLSFAEKATEIGLLVLDVGIDFVPGVSTARSAIELFTGKNIVTGEEFTKLDYSMAFVGLFTGLVGFNVSKVAFEPATELISKLGKKLSLPWARSAKEVRNNLPQIDNLVAYYKKLKKPFVELKDSGLLNNYLKLKYGRFKDPPFIGSYLRRMTEAGEEYCRIVTRETKVLKLDNIVHSSGGIFVFRCQDILNKTMAEMIQLGAIPDSKGVAYIAKIIPPINTLTFEGIARKMGMNEGGGLQIFLDISEKMELNKINKESIYKELVDVFTGF